MRIWKRGGDGAAEHDPWYLTYFDPDAGKERSAVASADVEITARQAREISRRLDMRRLGQISDRDAKLAEHAERPIDEHVDAYKEWLVLKGRTDKQAKEVASRIRKMIAICEWGTLKDLDAGDLEMAVAETVRGEWDRSLKTCNDYLKSMHQWSRWMARTKIGRLPYDKLAGIELYNAETDPRHPRRALTPEQFLKVFESTRGRPEYVTRVGPPREAISGEDRAMYYLVKVHTGLRNLEAASLTPESFQLDGVDEPALVVAAAYSKHRKRDVLPLSPAIVEPLAAWLAGKPAGQKLWALDGKPHLMWRADLEAAGFAYCDNGLYGDLYALRHTFATLIGKQVDSIKTLQQLMRHSDIRLTARYMHTTLLDQRRALEGLPLPSAKSPQAQRLRATGTDGKNAQQEDPDRVRLRGGLTGDSAPPSQLEVKSGSLLRLHGADEQKRPAGDLGVGLRNRRFQVRVLKGAFPETQANEGVSDGGAAPDPDRADDAQRQAQRGADPHSCDAAASSPDAPPPAPSIPTLQQIAAWLSEHQRRTADDPKGGPVA